MNKLRFFSIASLMGVAISALAAQVPATAEAPIQDSMEPSIHSLFNTQTAAVRIGFIPPSGEGMPRHTRGGATRGSCDALQVLPENGSGLTTAAKPMLQAYVRENVEQVSVTIEADDGSEYYAYEEGSNFSLPAEKGIVDVPLPETLVELTPNKQYTWSLILLCAEGVDSEDVGPNAPVITGGIRRIAPVLTSSQEETLTLEEKANIYSSNGLWYDLVNTMRLMQADNPASIQVAQQWKELLSSVGLNAVFEESLAER